MKKILYSNFAVRLKKIAAYLLTSGAVGFIIRKIYKDKIPHNSRIIYTNNTVIKNNVIAYLFFNAYESSEIRFIKKHLNTEYPVIELGCSLGVVAMQIAARTNQPIISVEANPNLISIIENNLKRNNVRTVKVVNAIIQRVVRDSILYQARIIQQDKSARTK